MPKGELATRAGEHVESAVAVAVLRRLQEQTGDLDGDLLRELVDVFVVDAEETNRRLRELFERGDGSAMCKEAHRLKSGAANLGAMKMAFLCSELEHNGECADLALLQSLLDQLLEETVRTTEDLHAYLASL